MKTMTTQEGIEALRDFSERAYNLMENISSLAADLEEAHLKAYARHLNTALSTLNLLSEWLMDKAKDLEEDLSR